ncbi:MAG TPA: hypothetical protein PLX89_24655 [Verrucomicrobiota bacterium]|nr:hypothetical protein [Verrucomicrobiota bacterium]
MNRLDLYQGLAHLRQETRWVRELRSGASASGATSWLTVAAPAAGLMAAGALLKRGTMFGRISGLLKLAAVVYPVVRAWQQHRRTAAEGFKRR